MGHYPQRRDRLLAKIQGEGLDAVLVTNPLNVTYLTGFSGESSFLILSPKKTLLISDGRFTQQLQEECPGLEVLIRPPSQSIGEATAATLGKLGVTSVGFESAHLTVADFQGLSAQTAVISWKPAPNRVEQLRQTKDAWEIEQIRAAIAIAEKAYLAFRASIRSASTEKDLVDGLETLVRKAGGKCTAFPSIVAVGERAALPHAPPTDRAVAGESLVLVDWGASGPFYKSDLTRVLVPHNNASRTGAGEPKFREIYETVRLAQAAAIAVLRPGVKAGEVDAAARRTIAEAGYGEYFTHSIGHGFGLQIHEAPLMKPDSQMVLEAGMVVTVEPGIYLPGWGGVRIEDDVLLTADGAEVLTSLPKDLSSTKLELSS